jgi:hypothetical protein
MKVRAYFQAVAQINNEEIPQLPQYSNNQQLSNDKILDIILHGTPKSSWQVEMDRQGFNPLDNTLPDAIDFMENIKAAKDHSHQSDTVATLEEEFFLQQHQQRQE